MSDDRLMAALSRIDQALARLEAASVSRPTGNSGDDDGAFSALEARHEALKKETLSAIGELDQLIASVRGD